MGHRRGVDAETGEGPVCEDRPCWMRRRKTGNGNVRASDVLETARPLARR